MHLWSILNVFVWTNHRCDKLETKCVLFYLKTICFNFASGIICYNSLIDFFCVFSWRELMMIYKDKV